MRSILAQAEYAYRICEWDANGVPFRLHAYVPECDPITKEEFHEREDHAHLLKVINKIMYNFKLQLTKYGLFPHRELQHVPEKDDILPFVWSGTRKPWLTGRLDSPFRH